MIFGTLGVFTHYLVHDGVVVESWSWCPSLPFALSSSLSSPAAAAVYLLCMRAPELRCTIVANVPLDIRSSFIDPFSSRFRTVSDFFFFRGSLLIAAATFWVVWLPPLPRSSLLVSTSLPSALRVSSSPALLPVTNVCLHYSTRFDQHPNWGFYRLAFQ